MHTSDSLKTLTVQELSKVIKKSPASIYSDLIRNPSSLPLPLRITGSRRLLWLESDVAQWLTCFYVKSDTNSFPAKPKLQVQSSKPKIGRPARPSITDGGASK